MYFLLKRKLYIFCICILWCLLIWWWWALSIFPIHWRLSISDDIWRDVRIIRVLNGSIVDKARSLGKEWEDVKVLFRLRHLLFLSHCQIIYAFSFNSCINSNKSNRLIFFVKYSEVNSIIPTWYNWR